MKENKNGNQVQEIKKDQTNEGKPQEDTNPGNTSDAATDTQDPQTNTQPEKGKKRLKFRSPITMVEVEAKPEDPAKAEKREKRKARWRKIKNIASFTALAIGVGGVAYGKYAMDKAKEEEFNEQVQEIEDQTAPDMGYTPEDTETDD